MILGSWPAQKHSAAMRTSVASSPSWADTAVAAPCDAITTIVALFLWGEVPYILRRNSEVTIRPTTRQWRHLPHSPQTGVQHFLVSSPLSRRPGRLISIMCISLCPLSTVSVNQIYQPYRLYNVLVIYAVALLFVCWMYPKNQKPKKIKK